MVLHAQFQERNVSHSSLFALHYSLNTRELRCHQEMCRLPRWMGAGGGAGQREEATGCCGTCPYLSPARIGSLQLSTFISWFLVLWLQISNIISVPWQSDPFPGKEAGHSLKVTRFRERAHASSPETSSPLRALKPGWHLPKRPTRAQQPAPALVQSVGAVQTWVLQRNPLWPPAL